MQCVKRAEDGQVYDKFKMFLFAKCVETFVRGFITSKRAQTYLPSLQVTCMRCKITPSSHTISPAAKCSFEMKPETLNSHKSKLSSRTPDDLARLEQEALLAMGAASGMQCPKGQADTPHSPFLFP